MIQTIPGAKWLLRIYVNGASPRSLPAIANLRQICEDNLAGQYEIEVVDLIEQPHLAEVEQIAAIPTVERRLPLPVRRVIGDLSDTASALSGLQIEPKK